MYERIRRCSQPSILAACITMFELWCCKIKLRVFRAQAIMMRYPDVLSTCTSGFD